MDKPIAYVWGPCACVSNADESVEARCKQAGMTPVQGRLEGTPEQAVAAGCELRLPQIVVPEGRELRPYQKEAVRYAQRRRGTLIADEMGLGKTAEAIVLCNGLEPSALFLVVCPATLKGNWAKEILAWDAHDPLIYIPDTELSLPRRWPTGRIWVIVNSERLVGRDETHMTALWRELMRQQWQAVVLDEAHAFKNQDAARTARVFGSRKRRGWPAQAGLTDRAKRIVALTGTPIPNRVRELWTLVHALAPGEFAKEWDFLQMYCDAKKIKVPMRGHRELQEVWNFDGASRLPQLNARLRETCMIRRLKKDVLTELPAKVRQIIPLDAQELKAAADAEREGWLRVAPGIDEQTADVLLAQATQDAFAYEQALDNLEVSLDGVDTAKLAAERQALALAKVPLVTQHVLEALEQPDQKVVLMAYHHAVVEALVSALPDSGTLALYGKTPQAKRSAIVEQFQGNPATRVLVGGIDVAGQGITLTAATLMIFAETDYKPGALAQCEDRIHRLGQQDRVLIQYMVVDRSVESFVLAVALRKMSVIGQAIDAAPAPKRSYPAVNDAQRAECLKTLSLWLAAGEDVSAFGEETLNILRAIKQRSRKRPLTSGEVWYCKRVQQRLKGE